MAVTLERELEVFNRELPQLLATHRGQYALVGGDPPKLLGTYATDEAAIEAGYDALGLHTAFLVQQIAEPEAPKYFARNIRSCPT
jgi:hypothetical protein